MSETHHGHHEMPTSGRALNVVALSATLHCLTGCAIGEVLGMVIGTALGFSEWGTVALAVALAFFFGYLLTSLPLLRAGLALSAVIPIALAADTLSIAVMEIVDNAIMLAVPGAMEAGLDNVLFWGALSFALVVAGAVALPVNRRLIRRGKGHAVVHATGIHGGPSPRVVGAIAAVAFVFGSTVLLAEVFGSDEPSRPAGDGHAAVTARTVSAMPPTVRPPTVHGRTPGRQWGRSGIGRLRRGRRGGVSGGRDDPQPALPVTPAMVLDAILAADVYGRERRTLRSASGRCRPWRPDACGGPGPCARTVRAALRTPTSARADRRRRRPGAATDRRPSRASSR